MEVLMSICLTLVFDIIRDWYCHLYGDCRSSPTLKSNPSYKLQSNWAIVLLSYNYAYFYGTMLHLLLQLINTYFNLETSINIPKEVIRFVIVSFLQRFMCVAVMNTIHKRTSYIVHAGYYSLYFMGGRINTPMYYIMSFISILTSVLWIRVWGKQYDYAWDKQYVNGILTNINKKNKSNPFYKQAYPPFELYHLYLVGILSIIYFSVCTFVI